jgi:hypothetical protein
MLLIMDQCSLSETRPSTHPVVRRRHRPGKGAGLIETFHPLGRLRPANLFDGALQNGSERISGLEKRKLDA